MNKQERLILSTINIIFALRMLGIFTILPILSNYGMQLIGANASLIGVAIGIYGCTQILFQIPYGLASDKIGRKPVIIGGLLISAIGTSIAAITNTIEGVILGRALQGTSAINGVLIAVLLDQLQEKNKTKAMMTVGLNFSVMFATSITLGPILANTVGLQGLFLSITLTTLLGLILTILYIPSPKKSSPTHQNLTIKNIHLLKLLTNSQLIRLDCSIFFLHTILILNFIALPHMMDTLQILPTQQSKIYCINITISLIISIIAILYTEKKKNMKKILILSTYILLGSEIILSYSINNFQFLLFSGILFFFIAFNLIEGILPSFLSKETPRNYKGVVTGIFSTSQFLGTAFGGILGGYLSHQYNIQTIFYFIILLIITWLIIIYSLKEPPYQN